MAAKLIAITTDDGGLIVHLREQDEHALGPARTINAPSEVERHLVEAVGKVNALTADTPKRGERRVR